MNFFDKDNLIFTWLGYPMSYLEFLGSAAGGMAVWLSAKTNVLSWPLGLVNVVLFFFLFYQVQLYPDMFLQVFFFITNLVGWWRWTHPKAAEEDRKQELKVSWMTRREWWWTILPVISGTVLFGTLASRLHLWLPDLFNLPSAFPYADSFVTVISISATYLMVQKKIECWLAWIMADLVATALYFAKSIMLVSAEYASFCVIAAFGYWHWRKEYLTYSS